ncbi:hypothetical protein Lalb_Chr20g0119641 [Lupinus albus]|uniref:Uncharacterized protein n=1 Tax=Lupinus albus TaxID=3870 RepID=A0A6A4NYU4_LUPAL|nr:hypothetical protein Lalb_Chr20g0119641 [Lupinus albus]
MNLLVKWRMLHEKLRTICAVKVLEYLFMAARNIVYVLLMS